MGKLTIATVRNAKPHPAKLRRLNDGDGLSLVIKPNGCSSWVLRMQVSGRRRDFGLGSARHVTLAEAREAASTVRKQYASGLDPVAEKRKRRAPPVPTFKEAAIQVHKEMAASWRSPRHAADWLASLERHAFPSLGRLRVDEIDGPCVRETLLPIWQAVPDTARRVLQRIVLVLDWAVALRHRAAPIPSRARALGLPKQAARSGHFAAMPFAQLPAFIAALRAAEPTTGRLALEFAILTAARSGEVRGATWDEFDLDQRRWTIPASRMKAGKPHVVPLCNRAGAILAKMALRRRGELVFHGPGRRDRELSDMALLKVLRDSGHSYTVHGFRSSFRDWAAERTSFPGEVAEAALAHAVRSKVEAAYRRTDFLERRRELMQLWSDFLDGGGADVIAFRAAA